MPDLENISAIDQLPPLREVISEHNLRAEKKLGQNFLLDMNITDKIARQAGELSECSVFEIGPGPGGLTRSLLRAGAKQVKAIEFDKRAINALEDLVIASENRLEVLENDALNLNLLDIDVTGDRLIIANLRYNIATMLLLNWLKQIRHNKDSYKKMILMFQKEVAQRIVAKPGTKSYGRLAVISQWLCDCEISFSLPAQAFVPPPKVSSAIVTFTPKELKEDAPRFQDVEAVTACAFGQRRKMVRSSLKDYQQWFSAADIDPESRAEELFIDQFISLAKFFHNKNP